MTEKTAIPETKYIKGRLLGKIAELVSGLDVSELYEVHKLIMEYIRKRGEN